MTATAGRAVVLAGGGTAGHVMPALAIADALVAAGRRVDDVRFVGAVGGMETELVPARGYHIDVLPVRGLMRGRTLGNVAVLMGHTRAVWRARRLVRRSDTAAVVSIGGYGAIPAIVAAALRRVPVVAVSYDAQPGLATRVAARFATATAVAMATPSLPRAEVTGAPIRSELLAIDRSRDRGEARRRIGVPEDRFLIVVVGGSLGSARLNTATQQFVAMHAERSDLAVRHVVGARNMRDVPSLGSSAIIHQVIGFESDMATALAACDVVVARAGASTVAELAALAIPAVLVPWPGAAADHQRANARWLVEVGGAVMVEDADWDGSRMASVMDELRDPEVRAAMARRAASVGERHGAENIAALIERVAR
jgi:undecaprenyldiphospho-muramoylpentapeptide beta-N-acetylglucosaminyltransferase